MHAFIGITDPDESARYLVCKAANLGYRFSDYHTNKNKLITNKHLATFQNDCERRLKGEPIQYLLGNWDFYDMTVLCKPPILIPRPETEELVDYIIKSKILQTLYTSNTSSTSNISPHILDIGAGSGVIGLALVKSLLAYKVKCTGIDINPIAVSLSNENARLILGNTSKLYYNCIHQSFLEHIESCSEELPYVTYDMLVSNPPYIASADINDLQVEVRQWEDHMALDGGVDGLDIIKDILIYSSLLLSPTGTRELWMEVSHLHPILIKQWIEEKGQNYDLNGVLSGGKKGRRVCEYEFIESICDMSGQPRFVRLRLGQPVI